MKALRYTKGNLEKIAAMTKRPLAVVEEECETSAKLEFPIYSVVDFFSHRTNEPMPQVVFVGERLLKTHFEFILREDPMNYTEMRVKKNA